MLTYSNKIFFGVLLFITTCLMMRGGDVKGQCTVKKRTYANFQSKLETGTGILIPITCGSVTNGNNAINENTELYSTLSVPIAALNLATATQFLEFTTNGQHNTKRTIPALTPVTIKFSLPKELLGVLSSVSIGTFQGLAPVTESWPLLALGNGHNAGHSATGLTELLTGAALLNALNGAGDFEITLTPPSSYSGIYLKLNSVLSLDLSAKLYHAYILEDAPSGTNNCDTQIDVLSGARPGTFVGGIASALAPVDHPRAATDGNLTTSAELDVTAQVLNETFLTTIFSTTSQPGDVVQIFLQKQGGGLLNLSLLNGFSVQLYNQSTKVGTALSSSSGLLSLSLLSSQNVEYTVVTIRTTLTSSSFDRVEIKLGGVATVNLISKLNVYEVKRTILPQITIDGITSDSKTICEGSTTTLSINEFQDCTTYNWYTSSSGGSSVHSGNTPYVPNETLLTPGVKIFYAEASRTNCTETSGRIPVTVTVNPLPSISLGGDISVCQSVDNCELTYTLGEGNPTKYSISWSTADLDDIAETNFTASPIKIPIPQNTPAGTYPATMNITNADGCSKSVPFNLIIHPKPNQAVITAQ